ncbi:sulfatase-like hydrolase/transferase [Nonomuraea sp. NPDC052116]|uniref:sulfatase-like hydrolase/transferase n=1 Tax=Nonomuraea sp. NPDC052116 TaxID=3155665 RepID=UPI00342C9EF5
MPAPNVIVILADDLGYSDLGSFGGEIDTPNLDRLARSGVRMTSFYVTPRCSPSRAALLTGRHPHSVGIGVLTRDNRPAGYRGGNNGPRTTRSSPGRTCWPTSAAGAGPRPRRWGRRRRPHRCPCRVLDGSRP